MPRASASTTADHATVRAQHDPLASPSMRELAISAASSSAPIAGRDKCCDGDDSLLEHRPP